MIQHTADTCPGQPCSTECDHVEFDHAFRLVYQADDGYTWAVYTTAESESAARQWFIDHTADDFAVEDTECIGHTINELGAADNCAIGFDRETYLVSVTDVTLPPVDEDDGARHFAPGRYLTVGDLRAIIDGLDASVQIVLDDGNGWYVNVEGVATPSEDHYCALTLFGGLGDDYAFDARQV